MPLALRMLGALLAAAVAGPGRFASAERVWPIEDFEDTRFFTDGGSGLGPLFAATFPDLSTMDLSLVPRGAGHALRVEYESTHNGFYGYVQLGKLLNASFPCGNASHLSLKYRIAAPQSLPRAAMLGVVLLDGSDCRDQEAACRTPVGWALENYIAFNFVLDDPTGEWREMRIGLCGDIDPAKPFMRLSGVGGVGNGVLDAADLRGFRIGPTVDLRAGVGNPTRGAFELDDLACVAPDPPVDPCAAPPCADVARVPGVLLAPEAAYRKVEFGHRTCCEICARDDACLYFQVDSRYYPDADFLISPSCSLFGALAHQDVVPADGALGEETIEAHWVTAASKRGALCEVCACADGVANCSARGLATVPFARNATIATLDLSGNPIVLVGPDAFGGLPNLERLVLPADVAHVAPEAVAGLARLTRVEVEGPRPLQSGRNFIADATHELFDDACCGRGASAAGVTFCALAPTVPGVSDATFEAGISFELPAYELLTDTSPVFSEAARSVDMCAYHCTLFADCMAYSFADLGDNTAVTAKRCWLYEEAPGAGDRAPAPGFAATVSGLPPRARALQNATLRVSPRAVEASEATGFEASFDLSLGASPTRGAVLVTPRAVGDATVAFRPPRVALYDAAASVRVVATAEDTQTSASLPITFDVESCDRAFEFAASAAVQMRIEVDGGSSKGSRKRRDLIITGITAAVVVGLLGLCWVCAAARRFAREKATLEAERALLVQQQVHAAKQRVGEFQAHFAVMPGDAFVTLEALEPHERVRDRMLVFDSIRDVKDAQTRGDVFLFVSHQWLGYGHPDPEGVHIDAMKEAARSVAEDACVPLDKLRIWLDIISIPQRNRSEQKLAIASLPTFASACSYMVAVAPKAAHADTKCACDAASYRRRAWCRAEIMSCWARQGVKNMYLSTDDGLRPLAPDDDVLVEALDVFGGELSCCKLGHESEPCDREELMLPMLGLYAELYRDRNGAGADAYGVIEPLKSRLFPKTFDYAHRAGEQPEEHVLFGDLVEAVEYVVDSAECERRGEWRRPLPDLRPGTSAQRRVHHSLHRSLSRSLSEARTPGLTPKLGKARPSRALSLKSPKHLTWALKTHSSYELPWQPTARRTMHVAPRDDGVRLAS